jgi:integrase/recombinase XerD
MKNLDTLFKRFLHERIHVRNIAPSTASHYRQTWNSYRTHTRQNGVSDAHLKDWIAKLTQAGLKPVSCNSYIRHMNAFCKWLYQNKYSKLNRLQKLKEPETPRKVVSIEDVRKIVRCKPVNEVERRLHTILLFLIDTGARISEVLTLRRRDVNLDARLVKLVGKGQKQRIIPISFELCAALRTHLESHQFDLVFCSSDGKPIRRDNLRRDYLRLCNKLGIERVGSFHAFRHTFAYNYANMFGKLSGDSKNSLFHLQKQLGHSDLSTTRMYVELQPEDLREVHDQTSLVTKLSSDDGR